MDEIAFVYKKSFYGQCWHLYLNNMDTSFYVWLHEDRNYYIISAEKHHWTDKCYMDMNLAKYDLIEYYAKYNG